MSVGKGKRIETLFRLEMTLKNARRARSGSQSRHGTRGPLAVVYSAGRWPSNGRKWEKQKTELSTLSVHG